MYFMTQDTTLELLKQFSRCLCTRDRKIIAHRLREIRKNLRNPENCQVPEYLRKNIFLRILWHNGPNSLDIFAIFDENVDISIDYDQIPVDVCVGPKEWS